MVRYLKVFSFRTRTEIEALEAATLARPHAREAQRVLAADVTTLVHGAGATAAVVAASTALFGRGELAGIDEVTLEAALTEAGILDVEGDLPTAVQLLHRSGLAASLGEARRTIAEGGANINNQRVNDPDHVPGPADLLHGRWLVLRRGKRTVAGVRVSV